MFHSTIDNRTGRLDLYNLVAHHPEATFFVKYQGTDLENLNIFNDDVLVVDRSVNPKPGKIAVIIQDDEFKIEKIPETKQSEILVWGIVTFIIHKA